MMTEDIHRFNHAFFLSSFPPPPPHRPVLSWILRFVLRVVKQVGFTLAFFLSIGGRFFPFLTLPISCSKSRVWYSPMFVSQYGDTKQCLVLV